MVKAREKNAVQKLTDFSSIMTRKNNCVIVAGFQIMIYMFYLS